MEVLDISLSTVLSSSDGTDIVVSSRGRGVVYGEPVTLPPCGNFAEAKQWIKNERQMFTTDGSDKRGISQSYRCKFFRKAGWQSCGRRGILKEVGKSYLFYESKCCHSHVKIDNSTKRMTNEAREKIDKWYLEGGLKPQAILNKLKEKSES